MKQFFLLIVMSILAGNLNAQSEKYDSLMQANLLLLKSAQITAGYLAAAQKFEILALKEKNAWEPYYYAALAQIEAGKIDPNGDKDAIAKKVDALLVGGETIQKNSELYTLHYYNEILKLLVDPEARWGNTSEVLAGYFQQAVKLNPNNPRIYLLKATVVLRLPDDRDGGRENALPLIQQSVDLFSRFKPDQMYEPDWGSAEAERMLEENKNEY